MGTDEFNAGGNPAMDYMLQWLHAAETGDKRRPDGPSRLVSDFTSSYFTKIVIF